jgi:cytochrome oxidase assembly protein ShyY1
VNKGWVPVSTTPDIIEDLASQSKPTIEGLLMPVEGSPHIQPIISDNGMPRWPLESDLLYGVLPRVIGLPYAAIAAQEERPVMDYFVAIGPAYHDARERKPNALPVTGYSLPLPRIHHLSYAAQWFAFAGIAGLLWLWSTWQRSPTDT